MKHKSAVMKSPHFHYFHVHSRLSFSGLEFKHNKNGCLLLIPKRFPIKIPIYSLVYFCCCIKH